MKITSTSPCTFGAAAIDRPRGVLVVDDEPMIRQFLAMMLPLAGYEVFQAESGMQALEIVAGEKGAEIDLLITDLWMPGMTGMEVAMELHALRPHVKTLVISGDTQADIAAATVGLPEPACLSKPFQFNSLCAAIDSLFSKEPAIPQGSRRAASLACV